MRGVGRPVTQAEGATVDLATLSVVSHGQGQLLHLLLSDLRRQVGIERMPIIVTLNLRGEAIDPGRYPELHLVVVRNERPQGFAENHNRAFERCETPRFVVLNPDLRIQGSTTLMRLLRIDRYDGRIGLIAPVIVTADGRVEDSIRRNLTPWTVVRRVLRLDAGTVDPIRPATLGAGFFWVAGMCMVIDADAFRRIGGFDESYFMYCEDYNLCARLYLGGFSIVVDREVSVIHEAQRSSHRSPRYLRWHLSSLLRTWCSRTVWEVALRSGQV